MSTNEIFGWIGRYYNDLVDKYGHDPRAADYGRPESQRTKYRVLADVAAMNGRSVLDVGCGFGDFGAYLNERYKSVAYTGVDLSERMIQEARRAYPAFVFTQGNILNLAPDTTFDFVSANGIFYLLGADAERTMRDLITRMFSMAREAVAFNSLSTLASTKESGEFYADPGDTFRFCQTLTPWVVVRHDYHPRDFTVYLYKRGPER